MKLLTIAVSTLTLATAAFGFDHDDDRRSSSNILIDMNGRISYSQRDKSGNRFGITLDLNRDRNRYREYHYSRDRYGYYDYDDWFKRPSPPYEWRRHENRYSSRYFVSRDEHRAWEGYTNHLDRIDYDWRDAEGRWKREWRRFMRDQRNHYKEFRKQQDRRDKYDRDRYGRERYDRDRYERDRYDRDRHDRDCDCDRCERYDRDRRR
jgi:hypothetical protein